MSKGILGRKLGMTAVYTDDGAQVPVTVIDVSGNKVLDKRTKARDGYTALVIGFGAKNAKRLNRAQRGFFAKHGLLDERDGKVFGKRFIREFRVPGEDLDAYEIGQVLEAGDFFHQGEPVDVIGTSKGRGFTGVMRRHNFRGTKATHGVHEYFRHGGAIGMATYPGRVFKNMKMPGQSGNARTTIQNVEVVSLLPDEGLLLIRGGLPGPNGGLLQIRHPAKRRRGG